MAKSCISCKREITKGQKECYICGASQNVLRYYSKTCAVFLFFISASAVLGYQYSEKQFQKLTNEATSLLQSEITISQDKITALEVQLAQAQQKINNTEEMLNQSKNNALGVSDEVALAKSKVDEAEQKAVKAESRANWLSKENSRHKAKIKSLNELIAAAQVAKNQSIASPQEPLALEPEAVATVKEENTEVPPVLVDGGDQ